MLKQVRHISEGNFYGLHVTNKARKLNLAKELRTLEACKDVQTHVHRKEEKELLDTLRRLQHTKHDHFDHHEDDKHPERFASHHDRHPSFHARQHSSDDQRSLRRPTGRQNRNLHVKIKSEKYGGHGSPPNVPSHVSTNAADVNVNVIITLSPIAVSNVQKSTNTLPDPVSKRAVGTDLHRTAAFMSCVICNLPRYAHGRESKCTCQADPSKHAHHRQELENDSKKRRKSSIDEEDAQKIAAKRERRRSLEADSVPARHALKHRLSQSMVHHLHGRRRASSFEDDNNLPPTGHAHEHGKRSRDNTPGESKSGRSSLDKARNRLNIDYEDRNKAQNSFGDQSEPHYTQFHRGLGSQTHKTKQDEELYELYNRLQRTFPVQDRRQYHDNEDDRFHGYIHYPGDHPHASQLPISKSQREGTSDERAEDQARAFSGLLHPDNIINHHHFLPYEANKQEKPRRASVYAPVHPAGFHVYGVDSHGHRQEVSNLRGEPQTR